MAIDIIDPKDMWADKTLTREDLPVGEKSLASLAKKYNTTAQEIARRNMVSWNNKSVNKWIIDVGGKMLESGWAVFQPGNKIHLPQSQLLPAPGGFGMWHALLIAGGLYVGYKLVKKVKG